MVAATLAAFLGLALVSTMLVDRLTELKVGNTGGEVLLAVLGGMVGALGGYLARQNAHPDDDRWKSIVASILALSVGLTVTIGIAVAGVVPGGPITDAYGKVLIAVLGGIMGALAGFIGDRAPGPSEMLLPTPPTPPAAASQERTAHDDQAAPPGRPANPPDGPRL
jgi:hypothetical protein